MKAAKGRAATIGVGCQYDPGRSRVGGIGCWCVAASPILRTWPTTPVLVWGRCRWRNWRWWPGTRWIIEDVFKEAKQAVGLDEYQVRLWGRLVPAHHPGDAGPCLSGGNPVLRRRWRW